MDLTHVRWAPVSTSLLGDHVMIYSMQLELQGPCYEVEYLRQCLLLGVSILGDVTLKALILLGPQKVLSNVSYHSVYRY